MDGEPLIDVQSVSLSYQMAHDRAGTFKEFTMQFLRKQVRTEQFFALRDVSFQVERGEVFSLIGANGAGKTTLMKIVARVLPPTGGRVVVRGVLAPMIALGAGFNPEMAGFENIVLFGTLLGRVPGGDEGAGSGDSGVGRVDRVPRCSDQVVFVGHARPPRLCRCRRCRS